MSDTTNTSAAVAAYLKDKQTQDTATQARMGFMLGSQANPDYEAELRKVAAATGVPVESARANPEAVKQQAQMRTLDFGQLAQKFPRTAGFLTGVEDAKLAHDDAENMGLVETMLNSFKRGWPALKALPDNLQVVNQAGWIKTFGDIDKRLAAGEDPKAVLNDYGNIGMAPLPWFDSKQALASYQATKAKVLPRVQQTLSESAASAAALNVERSKIPAPPVVEKVMRAKTFGEAWAAIKTDPLRFIAAIGPESLVQSAPGLLAAVPAGMAAGPAGAVVAIGTGSVVTDYSASVMEVLQSSGVNTTDPEAIKAALKNPEILTKVVEQSSMHAAVVGAFDMLSAGLASKTLLPKAVADRIASPVLREVAAIGVQLPVQAAMGAAGEAGGELAAGQELQPGQILAEAAGEMFGTPAEVVSVAGTQIRERVQKAQQAEAAAAQLEQLGKAAQASKLLARDADTFERFVTQAAEGSEVQDVYIDAKDLMQSGMAEQVAAVSPSVAGQLQEALATGGTLRIPVAEYTARIAGTELNQSLIDHLKVEPEGMSRAQAKEFMQTQGEELRAEVERVMAEKQGNAEFKASAEVVKGQVLEQLNRVARFSPEVNGAYATMMGNFYAVAAAKLGITPEEMVQRFPITVAAEGVTGSPVLQQGGIAAPLPSESRDTAHRGIEKFSTDKIGTGEGAQAYGVKGIKYLDGISRGAGEGSYNYVIFNGDDTQIVEQYYQRQQAQGNRGMFNPATSTITLLKAADLSTFLHESGHFFLEVQLKLAEQLMAQAAEGNVLSEGERSIVGDAEALLKWFGVESLAEWRSLDFEEMRSYHEKFARGFEAYLFEGRAPSIELQGVFQRFRAWLLNIYRDIKNLNVQLTDEVRQVFDRMMATNEEIMLAEKGRSMLALFSTAEQMGVSPEEFARYQALGVDATNEAIQDLQARTLRDLAWARNARGREIKRLQREAKDKRAEVEMDARREVMGQPVYRAWQFLTARISGADKITPQARTKSDPKKVDPTIDSLHAAIAKLGGLRKDEVVGQWGVDPKEKVQSGVFGKPVLRRDGGLSIDAMAERLGELGYLPQDENGRVDIRDFEDRFDSELRGSPVYSVAHDYSQAQGEVRAGEGLNLEAMSAGRFDIAELKAMGLPQEVVNTIEARKMTAKEGIHPDIVAELFGFTSGDELVRALAQADDPKVAIEALADLRMLERHGELATPEAIERAADVAIHNEARGRMIATEANALAKAAGKRTVMASAAREFARAAIARLKVRDIRPGQYAAAEVRAAKAAASASAKGDTAQAAAEKRNQLLSTYLTRAAYDAQDEVKKAVEYLKKFDAEAPRKGLDADYLDQIDTLLERFDLRTGQSLKAIDKRTTLAEWVESQREMGLEPDVPAELLNEAARKSYKDMTVEELRGLTDAVKQIEHLGRLKKRLLTAKDQREYEAIRDEMAASITANAGDRQADTRTPITNAGRAVQGLKRFWAAHIKTATYARVMDGGKDGGPVWEYIIRPANERGDMETRMRAEATLRLSEILAPVFKLGKMGGKGQFFPSINRSLNREARIAIALNMGNEGNAQRLLGGEGWTMEQVMPVLQSLTSAEWQAVQAIWDHFESYRPEIAAKERRVYGKEPTWVEPRALDVRTADGQELTLRGGYYPIKYDPQASQRAEEHVDAEGAKRQLQGAYTSATTRRSFTKSRVEEVSGRPLLYTLSGLYSGVNDVIHDLAWHEWLIDANRLMRSKTIDAAIRNHYGPEAKAQFKSWIADIAEGDQGAANAAEAALSRLRQGVSVAGLGFNVMSALMQPLGITQSIVRVGATWVGRGVAQYLANPVRAAREVNAKSEFMASRARTRFRELNELRNQVQDESATKRVLSQGAYFLMMRFQQMVDTPTWLGAYEKAISEGNDEARAISLADQAVIDAQGGGQTKDLAAIERGGPALKLFTVFYSFMNTALNLGVQQTMTANTPAKKAKLAADMLLLYVVPPVLGYILKQAATPGDDDLDDPEKLAKSLAANQLDYLMGLMVVVREFAEAAKLVTGANDKGRDYQGPAGLRVIADTGSMAKQVHQGEFDDAFRKAAINLLGGVLGLPAAQINRTITGVQAINEGKTTNPAAVAFGYQEKK